MRQTLLLAGVLIALSSAIGCEHKPEASVRGTVTVNGTPLTNGFISFQPVGGMAKSVGAVVKEGKFLAADVPVGEMTVLVVSSNPRTELGGSGDIAQRTLPVAIPANASGNNVKHTIVAGEQSLDIMIQLK